MVTIAGQHGLTRRIDQNDSHGPTDVILHPVQEFIRNYTWVHTTLGLLGNLTFFVGSVCFLFEALKTAGTWLFIVGAALMLVGAVGRALVNWEESSSGR